MSEPPVLAAVHAHHTPCIWVFVCHNTTAGAPPNAAGGRDSSNNGKYVRAEPFRGRVEHIDAVQHSGTWHLQVSGTKTWKIRPNSRGDWAAVRYSCNGGSDSSSTNNSVVPHDDGDAPPTLKSGLSHLTVVVEAGDVFVINTRLWFHQTHIDDTAAATEQVSFSYARDFYLPAALEEAKSKSATPGVDGRVAAKSNALGSGSEKIEAPDILVPSEMTNVEGTYATHALEPGDVVLSEEPVVALVNHQYCSQNGYVACAACLHSCVVAAPTVFVGLLLGKLSRTDVLRQQRTALTQQIMGSTAAAAEVHRAQLSRLPLHVCFCDKQCFERLAPVSFVKVFSQFKSFGSGARQVKLPLFCGLQRAVHLLLPCVCRFARSGQLWLLTGSCQCAGLRESTNSEHRMSSDSQKDQDRMCTCRVERLIDLGVSSHDMGTSTPAHENASLVATPAAGGSSGALKAMWMLVMRFGGSGEEQQTCLCLRNRTAVVCAASHRNLSLKRFFACSFLFVA